MRKQFPVVAIISLLAIPIGTASAEILYVTNFANPYITVIDTETDAVTTIPLEDDAGIPLFPRCIDFTPDGTRAYVSTAESDGSLFSPSDIVVIDTSTNMVTDILRFRPTGHPCVTISPVVNWGYISTANSDVVVIDTTDDANTELFVIDAQPPSAVEKILTGRLLLSQNGTTLYALSNATSSALAAQIEGADDVPLEAKPITFSGFANNLVSDLAITPDGNRLYVTMEGVGAKGETVQVFDTTADAPDNVIKLITIRPGTSVFGAAGVAITPDGQFAFSVLPEGEQVAVIETAQVEDPANTNPTITPIDVGVFPVHVAISSKENQAYVTNNGSGDITVINTVDNSVAKTIRDVGGDPYLIAILPSVPESPVASMDSFQCLEAKKLYTPRRYKYKSFGRITHLKLRSHGLQPENFCSPIDVFPVGEEGQGISDPNTHFTCYEKKHWNYFKYLNYHRWRHKKHRYRSNKQKVTVQNDLVGEHSVIIRDPEALCVSTGMDGKPSAVEPDQYFKCFEAKKPWDTHFEKVEVTIDDGSGPKTVKVKKPKAFCMPVDENYEAIDDATNHITCYKIKPVRPHRDKYSEYRMWSHWKHRHRSSSQKVTVNNVFGDQQKLRIGGDKTLCVPSTKITSETLHRPTDKNGHDDDEDHDHKKEEKEKDD